MSRVSLSRRDAQDLRDLLGEWLGFAMSPAASRRIERLTAILAPAPKPKKVAATKARTAAKRTKRATKRERTSEVRAAVMARANGFCECGCGHWIREGSFLFEPTMDHYLGKARSESVETCWALALSHHEDKTNERPSRAAWIAKWIAHCKRHGYQQQMRDAQRALESLADVAAAAALTKEAR